MTSRILTAIGVLGLLLCGCSLIDSPDATQGRVSLTLVRSAGDDIEGDGKTPEPLQQALGVADSIYVSVYPPGTGDAPEVGTGIAIPPSQDTVSLNLTVIAEENKRVAVKLYAAGSLVYFGVDENVDVVPDRPTQVSIHAAPFEMGAISVRPLLNPPLWPGLWDGERFEVSWPPILGSSDYHIQVSSSPDFSPITRQAFVADTSVTDSLEAGNYYIRVGARNTYAKSEWSTTQIHVSGAPVVSSISPQEVLRGVEYQLDIYGADLHHPSVQASVFGQMCTITDVSPTRLQVRVIPPATAFSDVVTVRHEGLRLEDSSDEPLKVQTIAYIMGDGASSDLESAGKFKAMIDSYGNYTQQSAAIILPYTVIGGMLNDLSIFDVIVVGHDTGNDAADWGGGGVMGATRADKIRTSGAAVLGIGTGGAAYFQAVGLDIGIGSCAWDVNDEVYVVDPSARMFNNPVGVAIPPDKILVLYKAVVGPVRLGVNDPPNGVDRYGSWQKDVRVFPFVDQPAAGLGPGTQSNFLWGFEGDPDDLTVVGHSIFLNTVVFVFDDGTKDVIVIP